MASNWHFPQNHRLLSANYQPLQHVFYGIRSLSNFALSTAGSLGCCLSPCSCSRNPPLSIQGGWPSQMAPGAVFVIWLSNRFCPRESLAGARKERAREVGIFSCPLSPSYYSPQFPSGSPDCTTPPGVSCTTLSLGCFGARGNKGPLHFWTLSTLPWLLSSSPGRRLRGAPG